jgi:hypothetical protein
VLEQYKLYVDTMEKLVARRQTAHTVLLSANAFLTAVGGLLLTKEYLDKGLAAVGIFGVAVAGIALSYLWRQLSLHYGLIAEAKYDIIHAFERRLPALPFKAELLVLKARNYSSMARREANLPFVFIVTYAVLALVAVYNAFPIAHRSARPGPESGRAAHRFVRPIARVGGTLVMPSPQVSERYLALTPSCDRPAHRSGPP